MRLLNASGLLDLAVEAIQSDGVYEFFVTLRKPLPGAAEAAPAMPAREGLCHDLVGGLNEERLVRFP